MDKINMESQYREIIANAEKFGQELSRQLEELLKEKNITLGFPLQLRIKTWNSINEKIERKALEIQDIKDVSDLIGLRETFLFQRDANVACELIRENFKVLREEDAHELLGDSQFGYSSNHFFIELKPDWLAVPTFKKIGSFRAEIQIRTVAQHIWAAASHLLQYKQEASVPLPVRRAISRVAALLELVDLEFERVLEERTSYLSNVNTDSTSDELNVDIVAKILDEQLPPQNKDTENGEIYSELLPDLLNFSVKTPQQLRDLLVRNREAMLELETSNVVQCQKALTLKRPIQGTTVDRTEKGVFFTHVGLTRSAMAREFGSKWDAYQEEKYEAIKQFIK